MARTRRLNKDSVVEAAINLVDQAGDPGVLTLTALAGVLEIQVPSLYNHIAGRQALQRELALSGLQILLHSFRGAIVGKVGRAALLAVAQAYREFAANHPGLYPLTLPSPVTQDAEISTLSLEMIQLLLLILATTGLEGAPAYHAIRGLRSILHGFVSLEAAKGFELPLSKEESFEKLVNTYLDGLGIE